MDLDIIDNSVKYNEILTQISVNLNNALTTFGSSSKQYQTVLEILKDCLRNIESDRKQSSLSLDPDTLSLAMGFLEIGK
ncbi:hypothetical protein BDV34DRAFT_147901 [Aspergillus parasiticus]|uniref:Fungal N-terminal domain-containing protein n=2 Tax=Aspergillus subgen. Circumdati TaxID=2720871 RepID=A0A5N6DC47_ASPPA|nr:hypothetical protein BDV34DRAFT_147901 [Aspergillus parasiticus]KAE8316207.1 hypothetical protein BDV41DRAFT_137190 [Aspergillus transmontanensis]